MRQGPIPRGLTFSTPPRRASPAPTSALDLGYETQRRRNSVSKVSSWVESAVSEFGVTCKQKLAGPGDREAAIRSPLERLLSTAGNELRVRAVFHDEVRDTQRQVRPDYGVAVGGVIAGYIEVKAPAKGIDPTGFTGHDRTQWERQRDLPNLIYTNGTEWRLYRDGEQLGEAVRFTGGPLEVAGAGLEAPEGFETLITDFLRWQPAPVTSVGALVRAVAPLTRLLRGEVLDQLSTEHRAVREGADRFSQPFLGLARDWRALLFPTADDATFADGYAQTVTFSLLLARTNGISLDGHSLHEVGADLGSEHSLMGKALQLLTDDVAADFKVTLDLLVRVIGAVQWPRIRKSRRDTYLHLYEHFLEEYDNDLRKASGSYYTPREVVDEMVRLTEDVLTTRLDKPLAFGDPHVFTVDPAMGTGTYLLTILERIAEQAAAEDGPGARAGAVARAAERVAGFELQMGPYAVAELRATDLLALHGAPVPEDGLNLYVTDTLDDPTAAQTQIGSGLQLIAQSRRRANEIKAKVNVTVVIGNPPYRERAEGLGGWVEKGSTALAHRKASTALAPHQGRLGILEDWRDPATARHFHNLKNLAVYFWRWATWKVWESTPELEDGGAGIVCFISTSGYLGGPGFTGMREYLRRNSSEGWIIDLTPEGHSPDVATRIFPGVRQPLAIGLFVRNANNNLDEPARIHYRSVHGRQAAKFAALRETGLDDNGWRPARSAWTAPFTPAADTAWDDYPALSDLMPWTSPGVTANRRWPLAPSVKILETRWNRLQSEQDEETRRTLLKETRDRSLEKLPTKPLPGIPKPPVSPLARDRGPAMEPIRVGYRTFDRQWVIPDPRVLDMPRIDLWHARVPGQVFVVELHSKAISSGPGVVFSALIPELHHFKGSEGGRTLPLLHPDESPNVAPGLLEALTASLGQEVSGADLIAYIAAVASHPAYTEAFRDELTTPGLRVPITGDPNLFARGVELGAHVLWLHTYGEAFTGEGRPSGTVRYPRDDTRQPLSRTKLTVLPEDVRYDATRHVVIIGDGEFGPVPQQAWDYSVGGKNVIKSWVNYRKFEPGGKKTSPLDHMHTDTWDPAWTTEFIDLLTVLCRLVELEPCQTELLQEVIDLPVLDTNALAKAGVRWPQTAKDRKPRFGLPSQEKSGETRAFDF